MNFGTCLPLHAAAAALLHAAAAALLHAAAAALLLAPALSSDLHAEELEPIAFVFAVEAEGDDVNATLVWSADVELPPVARLVVREPSGRTVGEQTVFPEPGTLAVESVADALDKASKHGLKYQVLVEGSDGGALSETIHFQVSLECPQIDECRYVVTQGVETDALYLSDELDRALSEVEAEAPDDVLAVVIERFPHLIGEVYALAAQLSILEQEIGFSRPRRCGCVWTAFSHRDPDSENLFESTAAYQKRIVAGFTYAPFYIGAQTRSGPVAATRRVEAVLGMRLRCQEVLAWRPMTLAIVGAARNAYLRFRYPSIRSCPGPCEAHVTHDFDLWLDLLATGRNGDGDGDPSAAAPALAVPLPPDVASLAEEDVFYTVNGFNFLNAQKSVLVVPAPGTTLTDTTTFSPQVSTAVPAPSEARLLLDGRIGAVVAAGLPAYAFGQLVNVYFMEARGEAECAVDDDAFITLQGLDCPGDCTPAGIRIERWE